jgi:hypothetical protein
MIEINTRDVVILKTGIKALIEEVLESNRKFLAYLFDGSNSIIPITRDDIQFIRQYEEIPLTDS